MRGLLAREHCSLREMKSIIGKLQFVSKIITTGRCFLRRLHDTTIGSRRPTQKITLTEGIKADLEVWLKFMSNYNGKALLMPRLAASSAELHFFTDSTSQGYGATFGKFFIQGVFPFSWKAYDIQMLEFYPIYLLVQMMAKRLSNKCVIFYTDNYPVAHCINKQSSRNKSVMQLLRPTVLALLINNITFKAKHIPGSKNVICDILSRRQISAIEVQQLGMGMAPMTVPQCLRRQNLRL